MKCEYTVENGMELCGVSSSLGLLHIRGGFKNILMLMNDITECVVCHIGKR